MLGTIYKLFKSHVNALMWILRILGPIKFCIGPIKISNGRPLKFVNLHVFEWDMGYWPILRSHHHFGLGLTLLYLVCTNFQLQGFFWPILTTDIRPCSQCQKVCFFPNLNKKIPNSRNKKKREKK